MKPTISPRVDHALKKFPPELVSEAKQALEQFLEFSWEELKGKDVEWSGTEQISFLAGYIAGRANKVIQSN